MNDKKNPIVVGVALIISGPISAFCGAVVFALGFGISFNACFYTIWGVLSTIGVVAIIGGIMETVNKRREN